MTPPTAESNRRRPSSNSEMIRRLEDLERYSATHGETITALTSTISKHDDRLKYLEELAQIRAIAEAREDERDKSLYQWLERMEGEIRSIKGEGDNSLEKRLTKMDNSINIIGTDVKGLKGNNAKVVSVIVLAVLGAFMTWVLNGGLAQ